MMMHIVLPLLLWAALAACGEGGGVARTDGRAYSTGSGRAETLIWWSRGGAPAGVGLRCPDGATAGSCTLEYRLFPPEERAKGR